MKKVFPPADDKERELALADCVRRLRERRLRNLKAEEGLLLSEAEASGRADELAILQEKGVELNRGLREVFIEGEQRRSRRITKGEE